MPTHKQEKQNNLSKYTTTFQFSPEKLNILTHTECQYFSDILIKQLNGLNKQEDSIDIKYFHDRASLTIKLLVDYMIMPEVVNEVFFDYYKDVTLKNVTKLLLRAKQLYEAKSEVIKIF